MEPDDFTESHGAHVVGDQPDGTSCFDGVGLVVLVVTLLVDVVGAAIANIAAGLSWAFSWQAGALRCPVGIGVAGSSVTEERITLWHATSLDDALVRAEAEAREYAGNTGVRYTGFAQAYRLADRDVPGQGTGIFSLLRDSELDPAAYVRTFFDTGEEHESDTN